MPLRDRIKELQGVPPLPVEGGLVPGPDASAEGRRVAEPNPEPVRQGMDQAFRIDAAMDGGADFATAVEQSRAPQSSVLRDRIQAMQAPPPAPPPAIEDLPISPVRTLAERLRDPDQDIERGLGHKLSLGSQGLAVGFKSAVIDQTKRDLGDTIATAGADDKNPFQRAFTPANLTILGPIDSLVGVFRQFSDNIDEGLTAKGQSIAKNAKRKQEQRQNEMEALLGPAPTFGEEAAAAIGQSFGASAGALAIGTITRNPGHAATAMGYFTFADSKQRALDKGVNAQRAQVYGLLDGIVEGATELIPMKALFKQEKFLKKFANFLWKEELGEVSATILQDLNEWMLIEPETPWENFKEKLVHDIALTAFTTPFSAGLQSGLVRGVEKGVEYSLRKSVGGAVVDDKPAPDAEDPEIAEEVQALMDEMERQKQLGLDPSEVDTSLTPEGEEQREGLRQEAEDDDIDRISAATGEQMTDDPGENIAATVSSVADRGSVGDEINAELNLPSGGAMRSDSDKWNLGYKLFAGLTHIEEANSHMPGVVDYTRATRGYHRTSVEVKDKANQRAYDWRVFAKNKDRGSDGLTGLDHFMFEAARRSEELGRRLDEAEIQGLISANGWNVSEEALQFANGVWEDYRGSFEQVRSELKANAARFMDGQQLVEKNQEIDAQIDSLTDRNFFPQTRFGKYQVQVRATKAVEIDGRKFKKGDIVYYENFENWGAAKRGETLSLSRARALSNHPDRLVSVKTKEMDDQVRMLQGMPQWMAEQMAETMELTETQLEQVREMQFETAPGSSFQRKIAGGDNILGYSGDTRRVYADYFMRFANHLARIRHNRDLGDAIKALEGNIGQMNEAGIDSEKRVEVRDWLVAHKQYLNNPGNELSNLRAIGFTWYLGFNPKSAMVNLTQVPLVTLPHLASQYGEVASVQELGKAYNKVFHLYRPGPKLEEVDDNFADLIDEGIRQGILNESLGAELAAVGEASQLQKLTGGRVLGSERGAQIVRSVAEKGAWMFTMAEKMNRYVTAEAGYQLARKKGLDHKSAITQALRAVEKTQFEYARFNRPLAMRGKRSAFFLFWQYLTNMMWFIRQDPGRWNYLGSIFAAAGMSGIPFAQDIEDLLNSTITKIGEVAGVKDPRFSFEESVKEGIQYINDGVGSMEWLIPDPDMFWRGLSGGSAMQPLDFQASLSMGDVVPGSELLGQTAAAAIGGLSNVAGSLGAPVNPTTGGVPGVSSDRALGQGVAQAGGAVLNIPLAAYNALGSTEPDAWRKWEKAMPSQARNLSRAMRLAVRGEETDIAGNRVAEIDPNTIGGVAQIAAQAVGFAPYQASAENRRRWKLREAQRYWEARQGILLERAWHAKKRGEDDEYGEALDQIRKYNDELPGELRALSITGPSLMQSLQSRQKSSTLVERNLPVRKKYRGLYEQVTDALGDPVEE